MISTIVALSLSLISADEVMPETAMFMFTATWCVPCKQMYPIIEEMRQEGYVIYIVDVDDKSPNAQYWKNISKVERIPHFQMFHKQKPVEKIVGVTTKRILTGWYTRWKNKTDRTIFRPKLDLLNIKKYFPKSLTTAALDSWEDYTQAVQSPVLAEKQKALIYSTVLLFTIDQLEPEYPCRDALVKLIKGSINVCIAKNGGNGPLLHALRHAEDAEWVRRHIRNSLGDDWTGAILREPDLRCEMGPGDDPITVALGSPPPQTSLQQAAYGKTWVRERCGMFVQVPLEE